MAELEAAYKEATGRSLPAIPSILARILIAINKHTRGLYGSPSALPTN
jgi:hypothetical protein